MLSRDILTQQLKHTLQTIELPFIGTKIPGKVRDSFVVGSKRVLVTSDRLSAFDRILTTIPFKGALLNTMAAYWFAETKDLVPNHLIAQPHPNVFIAHQVKIIPIEVVVRGYLAGSAWRDYQAGRAVSGITLPKGMRKSQRFENALITPSTKAEHGVHDEPISSEEVVARQVVSEIHWKQICDYALKLFRFGSEKALSRGLILVDTKYEFGLLRQPDGTEIVVLADEIHTPDSSRYWISDSYQALFEKGEDPHMLDKEFFRRWLIERNYMGEGDPPHIPDEMRVEIAARYMESCEIITGKSFFGEVGPLDQAIVSAIKGAQNSNIL